MIHHLTHAWQLELPDDFQRRREGEHLVFWRTGWTVATTVFSYTGEQNREILLANLRARAETEQLQVIEEAEGAIVRFGYLKSEMVTRDHSRLVLHAFTTAPHGCLQTSFYLDRVADLQEAVRLWEGVRHIGE